MTKLWLIVRENLTLENGFRAVTQERLERSCRITELPNQLLITVMIQF